MVLIPARKLQPGPILVTGATGQLGRALEARRGTLPVCMAGRQEIDFDDPATAISFLENLAPRAIVNAAAYTAVDKAETDRDAAFRVNEDGPRLLGGYAANAGIPFVHISTDYVFDGTKGTPYQETDPPNPTGIYGASKLSGETAVSGSNSRAIILRTSWVYAPWGKNFLLTMLAMGAKHPKLRVVADQWGCPTFAPDLADVVWAILRKIDIEGWREEFRGIFHAAGAGEATWHSFATAIFDEFARYSGTKPEVDAIRTSDWPTPAQRPAESRLDCGKLRNTFGISLPPWRNALGRAIAATQDAL